MKGHGIEKELEQILRFGGKSSPSHGSTMIGLMIKIKKIRKFIEANFEPKRGN